MSSDDSEPEGRNSLFDRRPDTHHSADTEYTIIDKVLSLESHATGSKYGQRILDVTEKPVCLSNCLVSLFTDFLREKHNKKQVVVNKRFQNIVRCEENIFVWGHQNKSRKFVDRNLEVVELPLDNMQTFSDKQFMKRIANKYERKLTIDPHGASSIWNRFAVNISGSDNVKDMQTLDHGRVYVKFESTPIESRCRDFFDSDTKDRIDVEVTDDYDF